MERSIPTQNLTPSGCVGHIHIESKDDPTGKAILSELRSWLVETGWKDWISASWAKTQAEAFVEFRPGQYQSNGPKKFEINQGASFFDFAEDLNTWLNTIEPTC